MVLNMGKAIKAIREEKDISAFVLSRKTELSLFYIKDVESNLKAPNTEAIKRICKALNYPISLMIIKSLQNDKIINNLFSELEKTYFKHLINHK